MRFVKHVTFAKSYPVEGGAVFTKVWRVRNDADVAWPKHVRLEHVAGDEFGFTVPIVVPGEVAPGVELELSCPLTAPTAPGSYTGFFRLANADNDVRFGFRLCVAVVVPTGSDVDAAIAAAGAGAGAGAGARAAPAVALSEAKLAEAVGDSPYAGKLETLRGAGHVFTSTDSVHRTLKKLSKWNGNVDRVHKWLSKAERKAAIKARRHAAKQHRKQLKAERKAFKKARKADKKAAKKAAKKARKAAKKDRRRCRRGHPAEDADASSSKTPEAEGEDMDMRLLAALHDSSSSSDSDSAHSTSSSSSDSSDTSDSDLNPEEE